MSRAITLKFKLRWLPDEAGYLAEKGYTCINLFPLISKEDKNISGSLILDLENDDVTCKPRSVKFVFYRTIYWKPSQNVPYRAVFRKYNKNDRSPYSLKIYDGLISFPHLLWEKLASNTRDLGTRLMMGQSNLITPVISSVHESLGHAGH